MRIAVISDIYSDVEAFTEILKVAKHRKADRVVSPGDAGYVHPLHAGAAVATRAWLPCVLLVAGCGTVRSNAEICPGWKSALPQARRIAACDGHNRAEPGSRCVGAIKRCLGGCDICQFLGGPDELKITVADEDEWAPIQRAPISTEHRNGYKGIRAHQDPGIFRRTYKFNWFLCNDKDCIDILASTIVHEAMHECVSVNPPGIFDWKWHVPVGCSAEELENVCVQK
jgi:hypothetical protein